MAPPYRWFDEIVTSGWLAVLSGPAMKLLWAAGKFYDGRARTAKADAVTLQRLASLGRSIFYAALNELKGTGLVEIREGMRKGKFRDYRVHVYRLVQPVPAIPGEYCRPRRRRKYPSANGDPYSSRISPYGRKKSSALVDRTVRAGGQRDGQNPRPKRISTLEPLTDSTQLGNRGIQEAEQIVRQCLPAASPEALSLVNQWAAAVARTPSAKDQRMAEAVGAVSQRFHLPVAAVREAVEQAAAVLHPVVQRAFELFAGRVIEVGRIDS